MPKISFAGFDVDSVNPEADKKFAGPYLLPGKAHFLVTEVDLEDPKTKPGTAVIYCEILAHENEKMVGRTYRHYQNYEWDDTASDQASSFWTTQLQRIFYGAGLVSPEDAAKGKDIDVEDCLHNLTDKTFLGVLIPGKGQYADRPRLSAQIYPVDDPSLTDFPKNMEFVDGEGTSVASSDDDDVSF